MFVRHVLTWSRFSGFRLGLVLSTLLGQAACGKSAVPAPAAEEPDALVSVPPARDARAAADLFLTPPSDKDGPTPDREAAPLPSRDDASQAEPSPPPPPLTTDGPPSFDASTPDTVLATPTSRSKLKWPFASESIWNMPLGSDAQYIAAGITSAGSITHDDDYFFAVKASDPLVDLFNPGGVEGCTSTGKNFKSPVRMPVDLTVENAGKAFTPNACAAFLQPDGKSLVQLAPFHRCAASGPAYGFAWNKDESIYGTGEAGTHWGSCMSAVGGTIRRGELTGPDRLRHALKLELYEKKYYYYDLATNKAYRWPAGCADAAAKTTYKGTNPNLLPGALLAIAPTETEASLKLTSPQAKKIFHALQDYGGYLVDATGWNVHQIAVEWGVVQQEFPAWSKQPFQNEVNLLFTKLQIVNNNSATAVGGGGAKRRAPLAPAITD